MTKVVLTGVDGSETALRAAEKAAAIAVAFEADLHVLSSFSVKTTETIQSLHGKSDHSARTDAYEGVIARYAESAERTASKIAAELRKSFPGLTVVSKSIEGSPGSALVSEADKLSADVIVVGNRRVQGPSRILGSVARTVAADANCDLYVVHTHPR